jgi:HSF-type DNA-binding
VSQRAEWTYAGMHVQLYILKLDAPPNSTLFRRQLNFYKFTREQSKPIKKSDTSSEIAKHQTFYHKFFQKGRPDLLKHLQRSRKPSGQDDDMHPHSQTAKKPKVVTSGTLPTHEKSVLEQISDIVRRVNESELTIKNLQQDNAALSFAVQKLQKQDEMKQRALVALQEQMRMSEANLNQALQQQQAQLLQFMQPLPFSREPSLSGVNASTLMRFLSIDPKLQMNVDSKLQRLTTPPFGSLTATSQGAAAFSAAAAAENLVQQAENAAAATRSNHLGFPGGATLPRHSKVKSSAESTAAAVAAASMENGSSLSASMQRHANFKSTGDTPAPAVGASSMGNGASLPRHPRMRSRSPGPAGNSSMLSQNGFMDNSKTLEEAMRNSLDGKAGGNEKGEALSNLQQQMLANSNNGRTGGISPSNSPYGFAHMSGNLGASLPNHMTAASLRAAMHQQGLGQGADFANLARESSMHAALRLGAAGLHLDREISNMGGDGVSREESFTLASLLDLSRSSTQPI